MTAAEAGRRLERALESLPLWPSVRAEASAGLWVVGGAPRDVLLEGGLADPLDLDLACAGPAGPLAKRLAARLKAKAFPLDLDNDVHRIARPGLQVDVARIQGPDILADLGRRDFTVNALAWPVSGGPLLDPRRGIADAARRRLRIDDEKVFREDPLRMLRVFRLAARLGLEPDAPTLAAVRRHRARARACAGERVRAELMSLLEAADAAAWLTRMDEAGLLTAVFPELEPMRRCARAYYGAGGVLRHSLDVVARADFLLGSLERVYPALAPEIRREAAPAALLKLAALLHDVAKPACARRVGGRLRFFGHDEKGAAMCARILARLRFSAAERDLVCATTLHHLRPGHLAAGGPVSEKAVYRFFRDLAGRGVSLLLVCWADHASHLAPKTLERLLPFCVEDPGARSLARVRPAAARKTVHHLRTVSLLLERWFKEPETARPEPLLDGHAVMKALGLAPGPAVGEALARLSEAQAEGKVRTKAEAVAFLKRRS